MPGASATRLISTRSLADHPVEENFSVERMTLRTTKAGPDGGSGPARGRDSDWRTGDFDGARTATFRATESEQLQQDCEQFHENSFERGGLSSRRTDDSGGPFRPSGPRRDGSSVRGGTDTREELEEDCEEVTEFSGHAKGSLIEGGCRSKVTVVTRLPLQGDFYPVGQRSVHTIETKRRKSW